MENNKANELDYKTLKDNLNSPYSALCPPEYAQEVEIDCDPWHPITDPVDRKHLDKLTEEGGEMVSASARCGMQGMDGTDPKTGKINRQWLMEEIADVMACAHLVIDHFELDLGFIETRMDRKMDMYRAWHAGA